MQFGEPETELAELGNREIGVSSCGSFASLLGHAVSVLATASAPGRRADEARCALRFVASGPQRSAKRTSTSIHASPEPS